MEEQALNQGVVDVLAEVYGQWAMGGGAAKVDINSVITSLQGLSTKYGNLFRLPPYFAYIARAFGVLEGIGLQADPDYAIVDQCLPYIAQRLLSGSAAAGGKNGKNGQPRKRKVLYDVDGSIIDQEKRAARALSSFIFGKQKDDADRVIDAERVGLLIKGLGSYQQSTRASESLTTSTSTLSGNGNGNGNGNVFTPSPFPSLTSTSFPTPNSLAHASVSARHSDGSVGINGHATASDSVHSGNYDVVNGEGEGEGGGGDRNRTRDRIWTGEGEGEGEGEHKEENSSSNSLIRELFDKRARSRARLVDRGISGTGPGQGQGDNKGAEILNGRFNGQRSDRSARVKQIEESAEMIARLLLDNQIEEDSGNPNALQQILLDEGAKLLGAISRQQWKVRAGVQA